MRCKSRFEGANYDQGIREPSKPSTQGSLGAISSRTKVLPGELILSNDGSTRLPCKTFVIGSIE